MSVHAAPLRTYAPWLTAITFGPMPSRRVTLKDVAREAGVSTGTVSMVLNDSALITDATKARVQQVMRDLGYIYHRAAANLRRKRSNIVGVSICDLESPYYADVTAGIQEALESEGRVVVLGHSAESVSRQLRFLETLREYDVEGVLLTPAFGTPKNHINQVMGWGIPVVQVTRYIPGVHADYVGNDNRAALEMATDHLLGLGHENVAYVGLTKATSTGRERVAGFRNAMRRGGALLREDWIVECDATRADGFRALLSLFELRDRPTGIVCFDDDVAFGVMLGMRSLGLEPGRDCSVVGVDDYTEAALWRPGLTTVAIERKKLGQMAGRMLFDRIADRNRPIENVVLEPRLVVRESCGAPPAVKRTRARPA